MCYNFSKAIGNRINPPIPIGIFTNPCYLIACNKGIFFEREKNMEKKSYFAVIPANVRYDKNLKLLSRMLYGEITALCNEKGFCWANNRYFSELYDVSIQTISSSISQLKENGYITIDFLYKENTKEIDRRIIKIFNTPSKNFEYPIKENFKDNNTMNNTINNNIYKGKDFFEEKYKKEFQEFLEGDSRRNNKSFNSDN